MTTYLEDLQADVSTAADRYLHACAWLEQGATIDHSRRELERAERETSEALEAAKARLAAHLQCPHYQSHCAIDIKWCVYSRMYVADCPDCRDVDTVVGKGETESEALEDYLERSGT